jgi:CRP/FNR family transcriptional regulator/CRP/FNR family cyclic AMP-dependent transcriptional regulator
MVTKEQLKDVLLFEGLSPVELEDVAKYLTFKKYAKGETIFEENTGGRKLYIIQQGKVCISKIVQKGEKQNLTIMKDGEFFGEISLLDGKPHSATAVALRDSSIFILSKEQFDKLLAQDIPGGYQLMQRICMTLCKLLRQMDEKFIDMIKFVWEFGAKT